MRVLAILGAVLLAACGGADDVDNVGVPDGGVDAFAIPLWRATECDWLCLDGAGLCGLEETCQDSCRRASGAGRDYCPQHTEAWREWECSVMCAPDIGGCGPYPACFEQCLAWQVGEAYCPTE